MIAGPAAARPGHLGAYLSARYLVRYFRTGTVTPFAIYRVLAGLAGLSTSVSAKPHQTNWFSS